ncbi:hypothetical protein [Saccharospirillum salsuginis]|uniref:Uncharacterized protein n=1 Tax=Saccharospirillum salsuginis TaxID=418750 RepID=A0A918N7N8_9GAMM|nr:hypothetical protein [Saccharospirillum salsuginis]GGX51429.1 hypothetical protein GCM10007392_18390 [Saccharospirillum salsuginis]
MFFTVKYAKALKQLGLDNSVLNSSEREALLNYGQELKKDGITPHQAALGAFCHFFEIKVKSNPSIVYMGSFAQATFVEWMSAGKIREEDMIYASEKITNALNEIGS